MVYHTLMQLLIIMSIDGKIEEDNMYSMYVYAYMQHLHNSIQYQ